MYKNANLFKVMLPEVGTEKKILEWTLNIMNIFCLLKELNSDSLISDKLLF